MNEQVVSTLLTIFAMFGVAFLTAKLQRQATKDVLRHESEKLFEQLKIEFTHRKIEENRNKIRDASVSLLCETEPSKSSPANHDEVARLIQEIQVRLDLSIESHKAINDVTSKIGLFYRSMLQNGDEGEMRLLALHGKLVDQCRKL
ncbi:MAG: hypothetical protein JJU05_04835 [Verrucomicrobia bacterium]|nr:hypothetical protein [Verrucomicrobiota bacterium]MCH8526827.1 hypothetical protein [Kiritimatiellia bacterium]